MAVFGYIMGAATYRVHGAQLVLSIMADILTGRYRVIQVYSELIRHTCLVSDTSVKTRGRYYD